MPLQTTQRTLTAKAHDVARFGQPPISINKGSGGTKTTAEPAVPLDTTPTSFTANVSPKVDCWRLVHDGTKVIALFQSVGETMTRNTLFCGTLDECNAEISAKKLDRTAYDAEQAAMTARMTPPAPPTPPGKRR